MNHLIKPSALPLVVAAGLAVFTASSHAQSASATIFGVQNGPNWDYTITLDNTGTLNLNSFWYGWTDVGNNLPSNPSSAANTSGWANDLDGNSIMWVNSSGTALAPGHTATFTFVDVSNPTQITAGSSGASVVYTGGIDFSQSNGGDSSGAFSPTLIAAPEPSTWGLLAVGLATTAFKLRNTLRSRRQ